MSYPIGSLLATGALLAGAAMLAQGCAQQQESAQSRQPEFRQSTATAPADMQLTCAAEVAQAEDVAADRTLPISSTAEDDGTFTVLVDADGAPTVCAIDADGNVVSLEPAEPEQPT